MPTMTIMPSMMVVMLEAVIAVVSIALMMIWMMVAMLEVVIVSLIVAKSDSHHLIHIRIVAHSYSDDLVHILIVPAILVLIVSRDVVTVQVWRWR